MLIAIGPHVSSQQDYTRFIDAGTVEMTQQQGNNFGTAKFSVWDPTSAFPLMPEDEVAILDDQDPAGFPSVNLFTNGSFEGTYVGGTAPGWGFYAPGTLGSATASQSSTALYGASSQQVTWSNRSGGTDGNSVFINQNVTLPTDENGHPLVALPYSVSCWYFITQAFTNTNLFVTMDIYDVNNVYIKSATGPALTNPGVSTSWQRIGANLTLPSNAASLHVGMIATTTNATNSGTILYDAAQLEYNTFANYTSSSFIPNIQNQNLNWHAGRPSTALSLYTNASVAADSYAPTTPTNHGQWFNAPLRMTRRVALTTKQHAPPVTTLYADGVNANDLTADLRRQFFGEPVSGTAAAGQLATASSSSNLTTASTLIGQALQGGELYAEGNKAAWPQNSSVSFSATGHGFLYDVTALEGQQIIPGTWSQALQLSTSAGSVTTWLYFLWWVFDDITNTYTYITTAQSASTISITTTPTVFSASVANVPAVNFRAGQKLYMDVRLLITASIGTTVATTVNIGNLCTTANTGGSLNVMTLPGTQVMGCADGWFESSFPSSGGGNLVFTPTVINGDNSQVVSFQNIVSPGNLLSANQSSVETNLTGFAIGALPASGTSFSSGGMTLSIDNTTAWTGSASLKAVADGTSGFQDADVPLDISNFLPSTTYTLSVYMKASAGTPTVRLMAYANPGVTGSNTVIASNTSVVLSTTWTRYTLTFTTPASFYARNDVAFTNISLHVDNGSTPQAVTWWMDGMQIEGGSVANTWMLGGTNTFQYVRGIAQSNVLLNTAANYTVTASYMVLTSLTAPAQVSLGMHYQDINNTDLTSDAHAALGPQGETASGQWRTLILRFGPQTTLVPPLGAREMKLFCGVQTNTTNPVSGAIAIRSIIVTPDPPTSNTASSASNAAYAGVYPTPYIDETQAGLGQAAGNVWQDREVTNYFYRANRLFGGFIKHAKMNYTKGPERLWEIDCADYTTLLAEAIVVLVVRTTGQSLVSNPTGLPDNQAIAQAFQYAHNAGYVKGVDWTTHVANLTTLPAMAFNYQTLRDVLSAIADTTIAAFWVDPYKYLWYQQALSISATFNVSMTPDMVSTFPFEEWSLDFDSTHIMSNVIIQGQSELSSPQTGTFNGATGMFTGAALAQGQAFNNLLIANPPNVIKALSMVEISGGGNNLIVATVADATPPGTSVTDPTTALTTSLANTTGGNLAGSKSYTFGYTFGTAVANPSAAATTGSPSTTGGNLAGGKSYTFGYTWITNGKTESTLSPTVAYNVPSGTNTNQITLTTAALPINVSGVNIYCTASTDSAAILGFVGTSATATFAVTSTPGSWNIAQQAPSLSTINSGETKLVTNTTVYSVPAGTNTNQITLTSPAFPANTSRLNIYCTASTDTAAVLGLVGTSTTTTFAVTSAPSGWSGTQAPSVNTSNAVNPPVQNLTSTSTTTPTANAAYAQGTSCWVMGFIVNGGLPIVQVDQVTYPTTSTSLTIAIASTNQTGFQSYFDPQPAQVTFDATTYPNGPASGVGNVVITYRYDNPVLVRLLYPSTTNTFGRQIGWYQNIENIQSTKDAVHQAQASINQYANAQPIAHLRLHFPPCPVSTPIYQGQAIKITHPPSLGTTQPVAFQVQRVQTTHLGNGIYVRDIDAGYYRPDFAAMMSQITQDASHLQSDVNASTILTDVVSASDSWTYTDSVTGTLAGVGIWGTSKYGSGAWG